jgi:hypothetical protein
MWKAYHNEFIPPIICKLFTLFGQMCTDSCLFQGNLAGFHYGECLMKGEREREREKTYHSLPLFLFLSLAEI